VVLAQELGVSRRQLYRWRDELDPEEPAVGKPPGQKSRASTLRKEVNHLKRVSGGKDAGSGFFQKCLAKSRGSTPAEQQVWREGIYDQIREVMPFKLFLELVDLVGIEPTTSSMPWNEENLNLLTAKALIV
jgi:hypothetical protein